MTKFNPNANPKCVVQELSDMIKAQVEADMAAQAEKRRRDEEREAQRRREEAERQREQEECERQQREEEAQRLHREEEQRKMAAASKSPTHKYADVIFALTSR